MSEWSAWVRRVDHEKPLILREQPDEALRIPEWLWDWLTIPAMIALIIPLCLVLSVLFVSRLASRLWERLPWR